MPTRLIMVMLSILILSFPRPLIAKNRISVFAGILPQKFFLEQIGKDRLDIHVMVRPGASPATYEPRPRQMKAIAEAKLYFSIGVPFEKAWLTKIIAANRYLKVIHTDEGIQKFPMATRLLHDHSTPGGKSRADHTAGHHKHNGLDPHIWLSPPLVMLQARTMLVALQKIDPEHYLEYESNYRAFLLKLIDLDAELRRVFAGKRQKQFMVFHPAWGVFAQTYGLTQIPIEMEGKTPKPERLGKLIDYARKYRINVVFAQPQFSSKSARQIAKEINGRVVFADPLSLNWLENLRTVAEGFSRALR